MSVTHCVGCRKSHRSPIRFWGNGSDCPSTDVSAHLPIPSVHMGTVTVGYVTVDGWGLRATYTMRTG